MNLEKLESLNDSGDLPLDDHSICHVYSNYHEQFSAAFVFTSLPIHVAVLMLLLRTERTTSTLLLAAIGFCDIMILLPYCAFAVRISIFPRLDHVYAWAAFNKTTVILAIVISGICEYLIVILSVYRFLKLRSVLMILSTHTQSALRRGHPSGKQVIVIILFTVLTLSIVCVPIYMAVEVVSFDFPKLNGSQWLNGSWFVLYAVEVYQNDFSTSALIIDAICLKLLPCAIICVVMPGLIRQMLQVKNQNQTFCNRSQERRPLNLSFSSQSQGITYSRGASSRSRASTRGPMPPQRTGTGMQLSPSTVYGRIRALALVMSLFALTQLPMGVISLGYALNAPWSQYLQPCTSLYDAVGMINTSVHFFVYCAISSSFREQFRDCAYACLSGLGRLSNCSRGEASVDGTSNESPNNIRARLAASVSRRRIEGSLRFSMLSRSEVQYGPGDVFL